MKTFAVSILLQREESEGWSTKLVSTLSLWVSDAASEAEAKGMATDAAMKKNEGFQVAMILAVEVERIPQPKAEG